MHYNIIKMGIKLIYILAMKYIGRFVKCVPFYLNKTNQTL